MASTEDGAPSYEAGAAIGGPIVEDKLGFRASAWYRRDGGYVDRVNAETGAVDKNSNYEDSGTARLALAWQANDDIKLTPSIYYQNLRVNDSSNIYPSLSNLDDGVIRSGRVLQQPTRDIFYLPGLKAEFALGAVDLTTVTSYFYRNEYNTSDYTNTESAAWAGGDPYPQFPGQWTAAYIGTSQNIFSQEVRLQSHDQTAALRWTAGLFYSYARERDYENVADPFLDQLLEAAFGAPTIAIFGMAPVDGKYSYLASTISHDKQIAGFGQVDYRLLDDLTLTAGLRVAHTSFDFVEQLGGPLNYAGFGPTTTSDGGIQKENPITPKFGLNYQASNTDLLYFSAGKGYRVGGANSAVPLNAACKGDLAKLGLSEAPDQYQSDTTWSYEAGVKDKSFGNRLQIEASLFHVDWNNIQEYVSLPDCGGIGFTSNLGTAVSNGFDLQATTRLFDTVTLSAAIGYTDATYSKTIGNNGTIVVDKGDTIGGSPWSIDITAEYDFTLWGDYANYLRVEDSYKSHNGGKSANLDDPDALGYDPTIPHDPAVNQLNLRLGMLIGDADVSAFANNVLNAHPVLGLGHDAVVSPLYYATTLRPLTVGVTATYSF